MQPISKLVYETVLAVNKSSSTDQLREIAQLVSRMHTAGRINDGEATFLLMQIQLRYPSYGGLKPVRTLIARIGGMRRRAYQASPDKRRSRERRRTLGGSSALPPEMRAQYTEGFRAVLTVVAEDIKRRGFCDAAVDAIAARAGVCRTTVQNALHEARCRGAVSVTQRPVRGRKNMTNVIRVVSREWNRWIARGLDIARRIGSKTMNFVNPTETEILKKNGVGFACGQNTEGRRGGPDPNRPHTPRRLMQTATAGV